jgi:hypothetical protein
MSKISSIGLLLILGVVFSGCSLLGIKAKKAAPDELFFVWKFSDDFKNTTKGFMDKTGKIVVGPWESFEWNGKKYGENYTAFELLPFVEGMAGICFHDELPMSEDKAKCGFIDKTGKIVIEENDC